MGADAQQHEEIVAIIHAHCIKIAGHVGACDSAHQIWIIYEREEEIRRLHLN